MHTLVAPARRLQGRAYLGQGDKIKDMERVVPVSEIAAKKWEEADARKVYVFAKLAQAARTKCAFLSELSKNIVTDASLLGAVRSTPEGERFVTTLAACRGFFESMTQPNVMASLQNLVSALEINILPSFGVAVDGVTPIYRFGETQLSYARTVTTVPSTRDTLKFGNLHRTTLKSDLEAMVLAGKELGAEMPAGLGAAPAVAVIITVAIIKFVVFPSIIAIGLWAAIHEFKKVPEIPADILKLPPDLQAKMLEGSNILEGAAGVFKWLAIGVGTLTVGGLVVYFVTK